MTFIIGVGIGLGLGFFGKTPAQRFVHVLHRLIKNGLKQLEVWRAKKMIQGARAEIEQAESMGADVTNARLAMEHAEELLQRRHLNFLILEQIAQLVWEVRGEVQTAMGNIA